MFDSNQGLQMSIETRLGLLDHTIMNQSLKIKDGEDKMGRPLDEYHVNDDDLAY